MSLKDLLSQVSATTLLLVFLFFCGTLYIIAYWSTFSFDITNYIELFDIPKTFVFPLATGLGVALLSLVAQGVLTTEGRQLAEPITVIIAPRIFRLLRKWHWLNSNFLTLVSLLFCMVFYQPYREWIVIASGMTLGIWGFRKLNGSRYVVALIPFRRARLFFSVLIAFIPVYSVCKGKLDSIAVWKNRHYYSVVDITFLDGGINKQDVIGKKLLGKVGTCIIITDSCNEEITVLNLEKVQSVRYRLTRSAGLLTR